MALTEVNSTSIKDGTIVNADVNASAAIALSKLSISGTGSSSNYLRGDGSWQTLSTGDGLTLANGADNRVVTATGAAALNGEANLTFDGHHLTQTIDADGEGFNQTSSANIYIDNVANVNRTVGNGVIWRQTVQWDGTEVTNIKCHAGSDTTNKDDGYITFWTSSAANSAERLRIESDGKVRIGNTTGNQYTAADNLIVGSGSGDNGLTIYSGSSDSGVIAFSDGTTDTAYRSGQIIYDHSANSMIFRTNGNYTRLTVDSTGIVDVTGKLRVDISTTGTAGSGSAEGIFLRNTNETDNNAVTIFAGADDYAAAASAINFINVDHSANAGAISFDTRTTGNAYAERMRIDSNGDVTIGTTSWSYPKPLNVQGSSGAILALSNYDTTSYAADTNTSIELRVNTGNTGNQNGSCEIRAFKENGTNGNSARGLNFWTGGDGGSPAERLRIKSDGDVEVKTGNLVIGTSGKGIDFAINTDEGGTSSSTVLEDYEEGTWTPTMNGSSGNWSYQSSGMTTQVGSYVKVGNVVTVTARMIWNASGSGAAGIIYVQGLPYTLVNITDIYPSFSFGTIGGFADALGTDQYLTGYLITGANYGRLDYNVAGGGSNSFVNAADALNGVAGDYMFTCTYRTA